MPRRRSARVRHAKAEEWHVIVAGCRHVKTEEEQGQGRLVKGQIWPHGNALVSNLYLKN